MRSMHKICLGFALLFVAGCLGGGSSPSSPGSSWDSYAFSVADDEDGPFGECPNIYYTSTKVIEGDTVVWTSSFGLFDYTKGADETVVISWSVSSGVAVFEDFGENRKLSTPPKDVSSNFNYAYSSGNELTLSVGMDDMHETGMGYMGNAHFKLALRVNGIKVKLGVNVHMEDPAPGAPSNCPN